MTAPGDLAVAPATMARYVETLGAIGEQPGGGLIRPVYTPAWSQARDQLAAWMDAAGLAVRADAVGTLFGRLVGDDDGRTILTGSHFDTVKLGGKFDGALGVLSALAALETLAARAGRPRRSLEMVALCEEEGSRFAATFWGTRAMLGMIQPAELGTLRDEAGMSIGQAMSAVGLDPGMVHEAVRSDLDAFFELHIEQGRILYDDGTQLGIVETITGIFSQVITVEGRTDHAGTTPMDSRHDALQGAAEMALAITEAALAEGRPLVATTGKWDVQPGAWNIVSGRTRFWLDVRHPNESTKQRFVERARALCSQIAERRGLEVRFEVLQDVPPMDMDVGLRQRLQAAADRLGVTHHAMVSGAGHDSQVMARRVPTAMLFVPSVEGRSHSAAEYTSPEDAARGASVLTATLYEMAY
ncbi:MAG: Zn-dependent hydrolase [Chloroflexi bacterium]|nr:Zn-dependent hydrolase [Chloroflexota bacterium]